MFNLIMVIAIFSGSTLYTSTTITQEFNTFESCEMARKHIIDNTKGTYRTLVITQGCFKK